MKKSILLLLLSVLSMASLNLAKAQSTFSLTELESLCDYGTPNFETYVLNKGYSYWSEFSSVAATLYHADKQREDATRDLISRSAYGTLVSFTTSSKQYYLDLKTALTNQGYKFVKEEQKVIGGTSDPLNTIWYHYANENYKVIIYSYSLEINGVAYYVIQIQKNV